MDVDNSPPKVSKRKAGKGVSDDEAEGGDVEVSCFELMLHNSCSTTRKTCVKHNAEPNPPPPLPHFETV